MMHCVDKYPQVRHNITPEPYQGVVGTVEVWADG